MQGVKSPKAATTNVRNLGQPCSPPTLCLSLTQLQRLKPLSLEPAEVSGDEGVGEIRRLEDLSEDDFEVDDPEALQAEAVSVKE